MIVSRNKGEEKANNPSPVVGSANRRSEEKARGEMVFGKRRRGRKMPFYTDVFCEGEKPVRIWPSKEKEIDCRVKGAF